MALQRLEVRGAIVDLDVRENLLRIVSAYNDLLDLVSQGQTAGVSRTLINTYDQALKPGRVYGFSSGGSMLPALATTGTAYIRPAFVNREGVVQPGLAFTPAPIGVVVLMDKAPGAGEMAIGNPAWLSGINKGLVTPTAPDRAHAIGMVVGDENVQDSTVPVLVSLGMSIR